MDEDVRLDPGYASAYYHRGQAYEKLGKLDLAKKDLEEAEKCGYKPEPK